MHSTLSHPQPVPAHILGLAVRFLFLLAFCNVSSAAIIGVSIPVDSQNPLCRPSFDSIWAVSAPPFPFGSRSGIGIIVEPSFTPSNDHSDFALHQNDGIQPSPLYAARHVPRPDSVTITYTFDRPQAVKGVEVIQHYNGITKVEGFVGNSLDSLVSVGSVFGPAGDVTSGSVGKDGDSHVFSFESSGVSGTILQVVIRKTSYPNAFALHRMYPLTSNSNRICNAVGPPIISIQVSQVQICWATQCDTLYQPQVRASSELDWENLGEPIPGNGSTNCLLDAVTGAGKFYQVIALPP